jgi:hypothetical protein
MAAQQPGDEQGEQRDHDRKERYEDRHPLTKLPTLSRGAPTASCPAVVRLQMPIRWARSSRWYVASPSRISELFARLK